ncbi:MAG TPA: SDR family oxidoreductase [Steroidobacteraceae bacterium]|nr:SDR family oxidoreductase [Steroidobacteraceae bacterium]
MHVFLTGGSGFIGSAVLRELTAAGHTVLALARSDAAAQALGAAGAQVLRGSLEEPASLRRGAAQADAVIHAAFIHDFSKFQENCQIDRRAIEALGAALEGTQRPLLVTSGTALIAARPATEADPPGTQVPRVATEQAADALAARGVRVAVMRLPPSVHGDGDHGFVPHLIKLARDTGVAVYRDAGANLWPAVHRLDAARAYLAALGHVRAGVRYHAVGEEGIPFRRITEVIGRRLGVPVASMSGAQADAHFGWFAHFAGFDNPAASRATRETLKWQPRERGLVEDLERGRYFS